MLLMSLYVLFFCAGVRGWLCLVLVVVAVVVYWCFVLYVCVCCVVDVWCCLLLFVDVCCFG